ncbi:hypothetical protein G9447_04545 [Actinopolyspora sp. BKK1]|nr:hypothetical protein [Actinopolyspora sp. BKK2]NHD16648.1 hypothetical protein [Actinopolyspora sp. BKK2]NHE75489.1 hypothetical protein [Actinopolyspora sp. BKK1]
MSLYDTVLNYWINYSDREYHRSVSTEIFNHFQSLLLLASGIALMTLSFLLLKRSKKALLLATAGIIVLVLSYVSHAGEMIFHWYSDRSTVLLNSLVTQLLNVTLFPLVPALLVFVPGVRNALRGAEPPPAPAVPLDRPQN